MIALPIVPTMMSVTAVAISLSGATTVASPDGMPWTIALTIERQQVADDQQQEGRPPAPLDQLEASGRAP